jgi:phosphatidate phosphatase PAH1
LFNELTKKTGNIKANLINGIKKLFTVNPFAGGLGNRENDAIAYNHGGIELDKIFIVDTKSRVQQMSKGSEYTTYE